ncbi:MAG TPA: FAD:protein FMN transferase [Acidimicrobiales bacterium]|jgi:thiamine biosynthesis lipoprotein|nr:FAD:protein FMN transferase [Acidimicrobiales bacterium]
MGTDQRSASYTGSRRRGKRFHAIGTTVQVVVGDGDRIDQATDLVRHHIDALDVAVSRFRDDSELTQLNNASGRPLQVSWLFLVSLEEALLAAQETDGIVDPTLGHAIELNGFDTDFVEAAPPGPGPRVRFQRVPGWRRIRLDRANRTVMLPPGVRIDLGATAIAGCADRAARTVAAETRTGVLVNIGGDIAVAGPPPDGGWLVRITDRHDAPVEAPGVTVALRHGGMATSGAASTRWSRGGLTLHHLIDPATGGHPPRGWKTVSVAAESCLEASIASTASVIQGPGAPQWLGERGHAARLVPTRGTPVTLGGWPPDRERAGLVAIAS